MTKKHPVEVLIERMSPRDQRIAEQLYEAGNSDEDLYAALGNEAATKLLSQPVHGKKRRATDGVQSGSRAADLQRNEDTK